LTVHSTIQFPWNQRIPSPKGYVTAYAIKGGRLHVRKTKCLLSGMTRKTCIHTYTLIYQVSTTSLDCRNHPDLAEDMRAAEKLKESLWGKELSVILEEKYIQGTR
jgi:hypothetical protein